MVENKKKIKKKDLLRRIEDLEYKLASLRDRITSSPPLPGSGTIVGPLTVVGTGVCPSCGVKPTEMGTCMSTACPFAVKVTC
jgi:hypothetical protein